MKYFKITMISGLVGLTPGCEKPPVVIGVVSPDSVGGSVAVAREEIAAWQGYNGPAIEIVFDSVESGSSAWAEITRATDIVEIPNLIGVVGTGGSRGALLTASIYGEREIIQIVPSATSRLLESVSAYTLPLAPSDSIEGAVIARELRNRLGASTITIVHVSDEFGVGLRDGVRMSAAAMGLEVVDEIAVSDNTSREILSSLVKSSLGRGFPDALVLLVRDRVAGFVVAAVHSISPSTKIIAGDGVQLSGVFSESAGSAADSVYVVTHWHNERRDSISLAFVERFERLNGRPPMASDAMRHDAIMVLASAARKVGANTEAVLSFLLSLGKSIEPMAGVTGAITFHPSCSGALVLIRLENGVTRMVDELPILEGNVNCP